MAGHSQFKNIMHRKGAQDKKRAKLFAKLGRELMVAAKEGGPDPAGNPRLRSAIVTARSNNMPKDNMDRAIARGAGDTEGANFEEIRYEGYGPGGVALIVEALTDNRNRTASEVRSAFSKFNGKMSETGAVSFLFDRIGEIRYAADIRDSDAVFEAALEAGAEDVETNDESHEISCKPENLHTVVGALEGDLGEPQSVQLIWKPQTMVSLGEKHASVLLKLLEALDDNDDVQTVSANYEIADDVMERLTAA
jgi:YebC/PmpR family DNA-binding regulatory protein